MDHQHQSFKNPPIFQSFFMILNNKKSRDSTIVLFVCKTNKIKNIIKKIVQLYYHRQTQLDNDIEETLFKFPSA